MRVGFSLIEVMIALAVSAVLITGLYQTLRQTTHVTVRTDENIDYGTQLALLCNQLEKDISAAFYPPSPSIHAARTQDERDSQAHATQSASLTGHPDQAPKVPEKQEPKKEEKDEQFFLVKRDSQGQLSSFTCITTNKLAVYDEEKPSLARVVYNVVPDKKAEKPGVFKLMRQESSRFDLELFKDAKKISSYAIADSLKKFELKCLVYREQEENQGDNSTHKKTEKPESFDVWNEEIQKKTKRKLPDFVKIKGAFWDVAHKRELPFEFRIPVIAQYKEKEEKDMKQTGTATQPAPNLSSSMSQQVQSYPQVTV